MKREFHVRFCESLRRKFHGLLDFAKAKKPPLFTSSDTGVIFKMNSVPKINQTEYTKALNVYERLVVIAITFSDSSGGINTSNLGIESTKIYTRLTLSSMTINAILPKNKINNTQLWDLPSVATLSRTFIETCHRYLYLSQSSIGETESEFRLMLSYYRLNSEKYRLYKEFGAEQKVLDEFEEKLPQAKERLLASSIYSKLPKHKADKIRKGNTDMQYTDAEIAEQFSLISGHFKPMYRLLSNHSHGSPFATFSQSNERGRGFKNEAEEDYMVLLLQLVNQYLSRVIISQVDLLSLSSVSPEGYQFAKNTFEME